MCISPITLEDGTVVACRKCWQCNGDRVNDWVGRCIAESKSPSVVATHALTLTYGREFTTDSVAVGDADHPRAAVLTYSDVQKMLKLLRRHGYPCRYFVAGEYGSRKGRAHWHIILFWLDKVPPIPALQKRVLWMRDDEHAFWPHGWVWFERPQYSAFRYNMKYILKTMSDEYAQTAFHMSKAPVLGVDYFEQLADRYASKGLPLNDGKYQFPEAVRKNGKRVQFTLHGKSLELYVAAYRMAWICYHGNTDWPQTELVTREFNYEADSLTIRAEYVPRPVHPTDWVPHPSYDYKICAGLAALSAWARPEEYSEADFVLDKLGNFVIKLHDGETLVWTRATGSETLIGGVPTSFGGMTWRNLNLVSRVLSNRRSVDLMSRQSRRGSGRPLRGW